jgi:hypothetical protein
MGHDILGSNSANCHKIVSEKHTSKSSAPFLPFFLGNLRKIQPRIFSAAEIFLGPLLRFAAEISAATLSK